MTTLAFDFPDELVEQIAERAAEKVAERRNEDREGFIDVPAAAAFLACPVSRIYALVSAHRIPFHKDGSRTLFNRAELREYVSNGGAKRP